MYKKLYEIECAKVENFCQMVGAISYYIKELKEKAAKAKNEVIMKEIESLEQTVNEYWERRGEINKSFEE